MILDHPDHFNNRELSWLSFNERVLQEAEDDLNPTLEKLKFAAIFSSNLDEFFMIRIAGLKDQVKAGYNKPDNKSFLTPKQQLDAIGQKTRALVTKQDRLFNEMILPEMSTQGILLSSITELTEKQTEELKHHFHENVMPVLTPIALDSTRPFPLLGNKTLNLAVSLSIGQTSNSSRLILVQVPSILQRFVQVQDDEKIRFILLEDLISYFIGGLFLNSRVQSVTPFRITRNADLTIHEEGARDLLLAIEKELQKRKRGAAVRIEFQTGHADENVRRFLMDVLELSAEDEYWFKGPLDLSFLFSLYDELKEHCLHLTFESLIPQPPLDLKDDTDIFKTMKNKDIFLHHPYESFQPLVDLIHTAAADPQVMAIKQTLYRVSGESPIIASLIQAAKNGKQVTVLVELKARFDEEQNIHWAKELEQAGVHVIFGIKGLKTHSKITLIVRFENRKILQYVHLGTGNYNDSTASLYTDIGLLTADPSFGSDAVQFFNFLSGYGDKPNWINITVAPYELRKTFLELIDQEISAHRKFGDGRIIAKMNSLTDKPLILKLYEASRAGVQIDLIVRGICCLRPGVPDVSDHITVRSIVDRFLEHSRIFYFHNNGEESVYLSSADWMTRNMDKRIEILFPIKTSHVKKRVINVLYASLQDNVKARIQHSDGTYHYVKNDSAPIFQSQLELYRDVLQKQEDN